MSAASLPTGDRVLVAPDTSVGTVLGAVERLRVSRRLLREHMQALTVSASDAGATDQAPPSAWLAALTAIPVIGPPMELVAAWWDRHPLRATVGLFAGLTPTRPWTMLLLAVAVGGSLAWLRPWRYALLRRAVYGGVLPQLMSILMSRLSTQGWLDDIVNSLTRSLVTATPPKASSTPASAGPGPASERPAYSSPSRGHGATPNTSLH